MLLPRVHNLLLTRVVLVIVTVVRTLVVRVVGVVVRFGTEAVAVVV